MATSRIPTRLRARAAGQYAGALFIIALIIAASFSLFTGKTHAQVAPFKGFHEFADCTAISGWAWDSTKPNTPINVDIFSNGVLIATVPADQFAVSNTPVQVGEIEIDPASMTLNVGGKAVTTTATEFRLLEYFARHSGRVFTRDQLLDSVWRDTAFVTPRSVDVYVRRIREKIEPDPENPRYLKTVRGAGYRFEAPK